MKFTEVPKKEMCKIATVVGTLWLFNIAMENGPFDGLPIKNCDFPWLC